MAAGLGFKTFNTGDVLSAADTNGYLMQGVLVFADAAARSAAITSPQEGQTSYLKDTDVIQVYSGSAWVTKSGGSSPLTTKGDLYTYSTTDARLPVGTNGHTLVADSAQTTGLKWAAPSSGALVLITSATFSGSSGQSINDCFSATYRNYLIKATFDSTSAQTAIRARLRVSGSDNTSNNYRTYGTGINSGMSTTTLTGDGTGTISSWEFNYLESTALDATQHFELFNPYATAYTTYYNVVNRYRGSDSATGYQGGSMSVNTSYTGITIYPTTGTMTGKIEVYGYAI